MCREERGGRRGSNGKGSNQAALLKRSRLILRTLIVDMIHWMAIHWFELSTLGLLILNLWFINSVLEVMRQTNRWLNFLSLRWDQISQLDQTQDQN